MRNISLTAALITALALPALAEEVSVFAAASMKTALDEVAAKFKATTGNDVVISYAGSNLLAKQVIDGAPADIFISAAVGWMDEVEKAGQIADGSRRDLLGNTLVLVAHDDVPAQNISAATDLKGMIGDGKLAMAMVDSVPAGQYGKESLTSLGLWGKVESHVAQADNVRAALKLVATGEAPYGIVYGSDAVAEPGVGVVATFPADSHKPITYPAAVTANADTPQAAAFLDSLSQDPAKSVFVSQGFTVRP